MAAAHSDDLDALRESLAEALRGECDRRAAHEFIDGRNQLDEKLWALAAELGWLAAGLPETEGGLGFGVQGLDVLHGELGRCAAPGPFVATLSAMQWLAQCADETARRSYLPRALGGELTIALPADLGAKPALLMQKGAVTGQLPLLLGSARSTLALVPVMDDGAIVWTLLETGAAARLEPRESWDRTRALSALACEGARPAARIADRDGAATRALLRLICLAAAADSLGAAQAISAQTFEYMKTRVQFGKPIASFQALKHRAADIAIALHVHDHMRNQAVEAAAIEAPDADAWAAFAKAGVTKACADIAADCVLLHGAIGHTWEYDCHLFLKRVRLNDVLGLAQRAAYDAGADALAAATRAGRSIMELAE